MRQQVSISQARSHLTIIHTRFLPLVAGISHYCITIIMAVSLLATTPLLRSLASTWLLMLRSLAGTLLLVLRSLAGTSPSRVSTRLGLISAASIFAALAGIALPGIALAGMVATSAGITLIGHLLFSKCRIICLHLLSFSRVYTPLAAMAVMRR
jgi:hypothetical protein